MKIKTAKLAAITLAITSTFTTNVFAKDLPYQAQPSQVAAKQMVKSINDSRSYDSFTLDNGMEVIVASDPSLTEAAISLSVGVGVGQLQDPESQQGLSHYLEHMIFMGSRNYPEPNALMKYISANNGRYNAVTEAQKTTYFFSINQDQFDHAVTMLSDALTQPLFNLELAEKELNAIDAEWHRAEQQDSFTFYH